MSTPTPAAPQPPAARPATSTCSIVGACLSIAAFLLALIGVGLISPLFAIAGAIVGVVGLARNEPSRAAGALAIIFAVLTFL